jgi:hypothetical protein
MISNTLTYIRTYVHMLVAYMTFDSTRFSDANASTTGHYGDERCELSCTNRDFILRNESGKLNCQFSFPFVLSRFDIRSEECG